MKLLLGVVIGLILLHVAGVEVFPWVGERLDELGELIDTAVEKVS